VNILLGFVGLLIALVLGELLYRWREEPARLWGNVSQAVYALASIVIFGLILMGVEGVMYWFVLVLLVAYMWLFRVRFRESKRDVRTMLGDAD